MSGIRCKECGRDLDEIGQDNMSCTSEPLCEDCWNERQSHAVAALKRENASLRRRNESLDKDRKALELRLAEADRRLREKLDAMAEETAAPKVGQLRNVAVQNLRADIELVYATSRERALALTKLDECELWLTRCKTKRAAAQAAADAAQAAAMPCLKDANVEPNVELRPDVLAETAAKHLRESMRPALRMAVE